MCKNTVSWAEDADGYKSRFCLRAPWAATTLGQRVVVDGWMELNEVGKKASYVQANPHMHACSQPASQSVSQQGNKNKVQKRRGSSGWMQGCGGGEEVGWTGEQEKARTRARRRRTQHSTSQRQPVDLQPSQRSARIVSTSYMQVAPDLHKGKYMSGGCVMHLCCSPARYLHRLSTVPAI